MVDRIDIMIEVPKVKTEDFSSKKDYSTVEDSKTIKSRVEKAREIQLKRFFGTKITSNSQMTLNEINKFCILSKESEDLLQKAVNSMNLSARAYYRILKLSRTIADLEAKENIELKHIMEALSYRRSEED
jgi:magnesium chelatase family protein